MRPAYMTMITYHTVTFLLLITARPARPLPVVYKPFQSELQGNLQNLPGTIPIRGISPRAHSHTYSNSHHPISPKLDQWLVIHLETFFFCKVNLGNNEHRHSETKNLFVFENGVLLLTCL